MKPFILFLWLAFVLLVHIESKDEKQDLPVIELEKDVGWHDVVCFDLFAVPAKEAEWPSESNAFVYNINNAITISTATADKATHKRPRDWLSKN